MGMFNTLPFPDPAGVYPMPEPPLQMPAPMPLPDPTAQTDFGQTTPEMVAGAVANRNESLASIGAAAAMERMQQQKVREAGALQDLIDGNWSTPAREPTQQDQPLEVLDEARWAAKYRPDLAKKRTVSRDELARAERQYDTYLKRTALMESISRNRGGSIPGNIEGQLGYSVLTGQDPKSIGALREIYERVHPRAEDVPPSNLNEMVARRIGRQLADTGRIDENDPVIALYMRANGRDGNSKKTLENLVTEKLQAGSTEGPEFDLFRETKVRPEKEPSVDDTLKSAVIAETQAGIEGPATMAWKRLHPGRDSQREDSLLDRKALSENISGIGGIGGLKSRIAKDPIHGYGELHQFTETQRSLTRSPNEQAMMADLRRTMRPSAEQIAKQLGLKLSTLTDEAVARLVTSGKLGDGEAARELAYALLEKVPAQK